MSQPGWYPDPGGAPNQFRYWDGHGWSAQTSSQPGGIPAAPSPTPIPTPSPAPSRRRRGPVVLVALAAVVAVIVAVLVVRALLFADRPITDPPVIDPGPLPSSTLSGGDDRSPTAQPTPSISTPPAVSTPPIPSPVDPESCTQGDPTARNRHPRDGRIHGGGLSFPTPSAGEWQANQLGGFTWAYDVAGVTQFPTQNWFSLLAVGALSVADGFEAPQPAAELAVQCTISSAYYRAANVTSATRLWSKAITVDGRPGWSIRTEVLIDDPNTDAEGDVLDVIVVDTDQPEALGMFVGAAPIGYPDRIAIMDKTISKLSVD